MWNKTFVVRNTKNNWCWKRKGLMTSQNQCAAQLLGSVKLPSISRLELPAGKLAWQTASYKSCCFLFFPDLYQHKHRVMQIHILNQLTRKRSKQGKSFSFTYKNYLASCKLDNSASVALNFLTSCPDRIRIVFIFMALCAIWLSILRTARLWANNFRSLSRTNLATFYS